MKKQVIIKDEDYKYPVKKEWIRSLDWIKSEHNYETKETIITYNE